MLKNHTQENTEQLINTQDINLYNTNTIYNTLINTQEKLKIQNHENHTQNLQTKSFNFNLNNNIHNYSTNTTKKQMLNMHSNIINNGGDIDLNIKLKNNNTKIHNETMNNELTILSLNIRSMKKHFNELLILINESKPDIITIIETFLNEEEVNLFKIKNFTQFNYCRPAHSTGGGIIIYIRDDFNSVEKPIECATESMEIVNLEIDTTQFKFNLLACYRLHKSIKTFFEQFTNIIENKIKNNKIIIIGDMNINLLKKTRFTNEYLDILTNIGYEQCIF